MNLKNIFKNSKGQFGLNQMIPVVITFVIIAVAAVVGLELLGDQQDDYYNIAGCNTTTTAGCSAQYNATVDSISGVQKFPEKLPMIAGVLVLVLVISILIAAFRRVG